jgi:hypothetical protein
MDPGAPNFSRQGLNIPQASRDQYTVDRDFAGQIDRTGSAAAGVLLGFIVFVLYWLVAGPIGFFALKRLGWQRHAWAGFLAAAGLFTAVAWGGATAIRPARTEGTHLTLLDHVYGQPWQRTRTWLNLLVPAYGDATLRVGDPFETESVLDPTQRFHNIVSPWSAEAGASGGFPDARGYPVESKSPEAVTFPTRSTVKLFQLDWAGGPRWQMPTPDPGPEGAEGALRLVARGDEGEGRPFVTGVLRHKLPGNLRDVTLVVVRRQRELSPGLMRVDAPRLLAEVIAVTRTTEWAPDEPWDLSRELEPGNVRLKTEEWLRDRLTRDVGSDDQNPSSDPGRLSNRLKSLSLLSQLEPPGLVESRPDDRLIARQFTHGWDLGRWFTQPCVIIMGVLGQADEGESPTPIHVNTGGGYRPLPTRGRTFVRWVYPLPAAPPDWPVVRETEEPAPAPDGGGE